MRPARNPTADEVRRADLEAVRRRLAIARRSLSGEVDRLRATCRNQHNAARFGASLRSREASLAAHDAAIAKLDADLVALDAAPGSTNA